MNKPTFYEQVGIIIPGAVFLFGLILFFPDLHSILATNGFTLGELGIFVLLSYAAGHLVAAVGNVGEGLLWRLTGGMPSNWIVKEKTQLLSPHQRELVEARVQTHLGIAVARIRGLPRKEWFPISRQLYAKVMRHGKADRIDTFNGNYGLNRGLAAASLVLSGLAAARGEWLVAALLVVGSLIYGYRAYRFGVHYARELFVQFLTIDQVVTSTEKKADSE